MIEHLVRFFEGDRFETDEGEVTKKLDNTEDGWGVGYFEGDELKWQQQLSRHAIKERLKSGAWELHEHDLRKEEVAKPKEGPDGTVLVEVSASCTECDAYWTGEAKLTES